MILRLKVVGPKAADKSAVKDGTLEAIEQLKQRPDVEYAHPNYIFGLFATTPDDACYREGKQWSLLNNGMGADESPGGISMPKAWLRGQGSQQITVAVVDTGIVRAHSDLSRSNVVKGFNFVSPNRGDNPTDTGRGTDYHGTHVASVIGAVTSNNQLGMAGINWTVHVQPVRVLGEGGSGTFTDIVDGLRWAAGMPVPNVPQNVTPARVINMSLGGAINCSEVQGMQAAIDDVTARGALVVVAAGNDSSDAGDYTPASCRNVLTVAGSGPTGELAPYSNYGAVVGILAPGGDSNLPNGGILGAVDQNAFSLYQGTSMATPHVSAVAALLLSRASQLSPLEVADRIRTNALPRTTMQCPQPCGAGLLNADIP
jgi:serine protease